MPPEVFPPVQHSWGTHPMMGGYPRGLMPQMPHLRVVQAERPQPGEPHPRLIASDHDMENHLAGQSSRGLIFDSCNCPGYVRDDPGKSTARTNNTSPPVAMSHLPPMPRQPETIFINGGPHLSKNRTSRPQNDGNGHRTPGESLVPSLQRRHSSPHVATNSIPFMPQRSDQRCADFTHGAHHFPQKTNFRPKGDGKGYDPLAKTPFPSPRRHRDSRTRHQKSNAEDRHTSRNEKNGPSRECQGHRDKEFLEPDGISELSAGEKSRHRKHGSARSQRQQSASLDRLGDACCETPSESDSEVAITDGNDSRQV